MTRKSISTNAAVVSCDVCGRTLLRGESADVFLHGGARRTVCELCTSRAVHEGWIREGLDDVQARRPERRGRSLLGRLRQRRADERPAGAPVRERDEPEYVGEDHPPYADEPVYEAQPLYEAAPPPRMPASPAPPPPQPDPEPGSDAGFGPVRERGIHAVPTNAELKVARALEVFNGSPHPRTVAGVARSLGAPVVSARPSATEGAVVSIVVAWELSWYRYEVDLGDEASGVRVVAQGAELDELAAEDRQPNATADERGTLHLAA